MRRLFPYSIKNTWKQAFHAGQAGLFHLLLKIFSFTVCQKVKQMSPCMSGVQHLKTKVSSLDPKLSPCFWHYLSQLQCCDQTVLGISQPFPLLPSLLFLKLTASKTSQFSKEPSSLLCSPSAEVSALSLLFGKGRARIISPYLSSAWVVSSATMLIPSKACNFSLNSWMW